MKTQLKNKIRALGIMNGTSLDGIDFVLIDVYPLKNLCRFVDMQSFSFHKKLHQQLKLATQHQLKVNELALLHHELGLFYAKCYQQLNARMKKVDCLGLHGQTVFHAGGVASLQIGEPSYLAAAAGRPVISDFRVADIALGGQGAPLATLFHQYVFAQKNKVISLHNLGGISNLSILKKDRVTQGFDTGPANMLLDLAIQRFTAGKKQFDRDGELARKGVANSTVLKQMLKHKFFKVKPPKSCGREEFGENFLDKYLNFFKNEKIENQLATFVELVAISIARSYAEFCDLKKIDEIIFCGGGAKNKFLLQRIDYHLHQNKLSQRIKISTTDDYGWSSQSIEGGAFALLAAFKMLNWPSNLPQTTGALRQTSLGKITEV